MNETSTHNTNYRFVIAVALLLIAGATSARAQGWTLSGSVSTDVRYFSEAAALPNQLADEQDSVVLAPEWRWRSEDRRHQVKIAPFARWDGEDAERTHLDLREGFYRYAGHGWDFLGGVNRVFWGVAESRHLVDVINQTDAVEDIDEEDKLGQPMLHLGISRRWGRFELFSLLGFRERTFPGVDGRLRAPLVVNADQALYESNAEERHIDWAGRWSNAIGDWDLGAHAFYGTAREPRLLFGEIVAPGSVPELIPFYEVISQFGVDVQYTHNAWLYKLEGLVREGQGETFGASVAGVEYTLYQVAGAADLGLIAELHWDGRKTGDRILKSQIPGSNNESDDLFEVTILSPSIYDEDTFLGARLALNDMQEHDVTTGCGQRSDLRHRRVDIAGVGAGHGLDGHGCASPDRDAADHHLAGVFSWNHDDRLSLSPGSPIILESPVCVCQ